MSGDVTGGTAFDQGGVFIHLTPPFTDSTPVSTVGEDNFNTPNLYALDELQNIILAADLAINLMADGLGGGSGTSSILAGNTISSHYVFFDSATHIDQIGSVTFSEEILGVITSPDNLAASDFLQNTSVTYEISPHSRGLESNDSIAITGSHTLSVDWVAISPGDYIRVITGDYSATTYQSGAHASVNTPSALVLACAALLALGSRTRKKTVTQNIEAMHHEPADKRHRHTAKAPFT